MTDTSNKRHFRAQRQRKRCLPTDVSTPVTQQELIRSDCRRARRKAKRDNMWKRAHLRDANHKLDLDVLPLVRDWIDSLPDEPKSNYLRSLVWSKFVSQDTDPPALREQRALEKWLATEQVNMETNERLISTPLCAVLLPSVRFGRFVDWVREFISSIIGDVPPVDVLYGTFSGGASTSRRRADAHPGSKFIGKADGTLSALDIFRDSLDLFPLWEELGIPELNTVRGAEMFFVPKSTTIDRVACKEPDINMYLQKGVGSYFRRRLRRVGIDLNNQLRNRELARLGSSSGTLATLDLSSASDSVSYELVNLLLPPLWSSYLNSIRSQEMLLPGSRGWYRSEMFSTMGNGFTFELESLIFFALVRGVSYFTRTKGIVSVYGDDIVCPTACVREVQHILFYFGFTPNEEKSFFEGPIRESCGGHYYNGCDITPFFIRRPITRLTDLIHLLNEIRRWAARSSVLFLAEECWTIWDLLSELIPRSLKGGDMVTSGKFQLISPHRPKRRLVEVEQELHVDQTGLYLFDQCNRATASKPLLIEEPSRTSRACVFRRAPYWTWHDSGPLFLSELPAWHSGFVTPMEGSG